MNRRPTSETFRLLELRAALQMAAHRLDGETEESALDDATSLTPALPERHLTDEEFIHLSMASYPTEPSIREHLTACPDCAAEWSRLKMLNAVWEDPAEVSRLEARRRASESALVSPMQSLFAGFQTSLSALRFPQAAFAAGTDAEVAEIRFPIIYEGSVEITGLQGTLRRKNRDCYARVAEVAGTAGQFAQRKVLLTIRDTDSTVPLLQRQVDVGVTVLLGTDLSLTEQSVLSAELLPSADFE